MIEANENIDLVTMKRQGDLEASQRDYESLAGAFILLLFLFWFIQRRSG